MTGGKDKVVVASGQGSWLEYLEFGGKVFWTIDEEKGTWVLANDPKLPKEQ